VYNHEIASLRDRPSTSALINSALLRDRAFVQSMGKEWAAIFVPNDISHFHKKFFDIFVTFKLNVDLPCNILKYILVVIAIKTQKAARGGLVFWNIFPLTILSLTSCSPAELASFSDSNVKIKTISIS
jgi:hypothetical protein